MVVELPGQHLDTDGYLLPRSAMKQQNDYKHNQCDMEDVTIYTEITPNHCDTEKERAFNYNFRSIENVLLKIALITLILIVAAVLGVIFYKLQIQDQMLHKYENHIRLLQEEVHSTQLSQEELVPALNMSRKIKQLNEALETLTLITFSSINVDGNVTTADFRTALHLSSKDGYADRVKFLIEHGANVESRDNTGFTPLHLAALYGHGDIINILLDGGAEIDAVNLLNKTALYFAIKNRNMGCVQILLERGADVYHRDSQSHTPFSVAIQVADDKIIHLIEQYQENKGTPKTAST